MSRLVIGTALSLLLLAFILLFNQKNQSCNTMVTLAPGATIEDVCQWWATQSAQYRQSNRYCGCGVYK